MNQENLPSLTNDFNTPEMRARLLKFFRAIYVGRTARRMPAATWEPVIRRVLEDYRDIVQDADADAEPESPRHSIGSTDFDLPPKVTEGEIDDSDDDDEPLFPKGKAQALESARESQRKKTSHSDPAVQKEEGKTLRTEGLYRVVLGANKGS